MFVEISAAMEMEGRQIDRMLEKPRRHPDADSLIVHFYFSLSVTDHLR